MSSNFIRSTIEVRQLSACPAFAACADRIASTSTSLIATGAAGTGCGAAGAAVVAGAAGAGVAASAFLPKIASLILLKIPMVMLPH
jgi:hypothetical protein